MKLVSPAHTASSYTGAGVLNVANKVRQTEAEGPGLRYALWVQGCPLRCEGCCNPHMQEDTKETLTPTPDVISDILNTPSIEGVTLIGGEPFWHAEELRHVARLCQENNLGVMVFTGLTVDYIKRIGKPEWLDFLSCIDLLIDGPYIQSRRVTDRRWIGSDNQRIHFLTPRYQHLKGEDGWAIEDKDNTIEIRMSGGEITINGWPHLDIVQLARQSMKRTT